MAYESKLKKVNNLKSPITPSACDKCGDKCSSGCGSVCQDTCAMTCAINVGPFATPNKE